MRRGFKPEAEPLQPGAFSAATFHLPDGRTVAVCNPCNDPPRTNSDIAHELAHILLDHDVREIQQLAGHAFLTCNPEQEEEANWLAGCLLLPRPLLLREVYADTDPDTLATRYQVSVPMARFRLKRQRRPPPSPPCARNQGHVAGGRTCQQRSSIISGPIRPLVTHGSRGPCVARPVGHQ